MTKWQQALAAPMFMLMAAPLAAAAESLPPGLYARIATPKGDIVCRLEMDKAPATVMSFAGLTEGVLDNEAREKGQPYFDGITFHRVEPGFVIQGGDPRGDGRGGPGYNFLNEPDPSLPHDAAGILSMANAGLDRFDGTATNGSQFFITLGATPHLDGRHTVFGRVVRGLDVAQKIKVGDKMEKVEIVRVGPAAEAYKPGQEAFDLLRETGHRVEPAEPEAVAAKLRQSAEILRQAGMARAADWLAAAADLAARAKKTPGGTLYVVQKEGAGDKPATGQEISAHYTGRLMTGKVFDSSRERGEPIAFPVGLKKVIEGWDEALMDMRPGEQRILFIPADQAYGENGPGGVIPPNAMLYFEVERVK